MFILRQRINTKATFFKLSVTNTVSELIENNKMCQILCLASGLDDFKAPMVIT